MSLLRLSTVNWSQVRLLVICESFPVAIISDSYKSCFIFCFAMGSLEAYFEPSQTSAMEHFLRKW